MEDLIELDGCQYKKKSNEIYKCLNCSSIYYSNTKVKTGHDNKCRKKKYENQPPKIDYEKIYLKEKLEWMEQLHDKEKKLIMLEQESRIKEMNLASLEEKIKGLTTKLEEKENECNQLKIELTKI